MKRSVLLLAMMFIFSMSSFVAYASTSDPINSSITIEIKPAQPKNPTIKPRTIVDCGIEVNYYAGALTFIFNRDLGDADIVVCNLNTGDVWSGGVSGMGIETILLSGDEGYYTINIYTDNGEYYGEMWL